MSGITVHYFDVYGRAEVLRMILHYHGTSFVDHRLEFQEWGKLKSSGFAEFSQLPVVDVDGHRLAQTSSISRYLCNKLGYGVTDTEESYWIESLCDLCEDISNTIGALAFNKDYEGVNKIFQERVPNWLRVIESRLERRNGGNGFFASNHPTRADFHVFSVIQDIINRHHPELLDSYSPKLKLWLTRFRDSSRTLKSYLEARPLREF